MSLYGVTKPYWVTAHHPWYAGTSTSKPEQNRPELWQLIKLFWFTYHWDLFPWVQLKWIRIGATNGLKPNRRQVISEPVYRYVTRHTVISWDLFGSSQDIFPNIIGNDNTTDVIPLNRWRVLNTIYTMRLIRNSSEKCGKWKCKVLKEARYKIIQHYGFSWKITYDHIAMIILNIPKWYEVTVLLFMLHTFESCMKFNFGPKISIYIWCDYFMSQSLVYTANHQTLFFSKNNYIFICIKVKFQLIATENFHFGTYVKCRRHSKYFHRSPHFGI